jgi:type I restriction enzyme R subunit
MTLFTESTVEQAALAWLSEAGWQVKHGSEIAPDGLFAKRQDYGQVVLDQRMRDALLPKLIRGEIRVKDAERFLKRRGL